MSKNIISILGTAQDGGLPHPNCFCDNCKEAIENKKLQRTATSLAIYLSEEEKWHLIDATPDLKEQLVRFQQKYGLETKLMSSIFLTHAHLGHYPGLLFLGKEAINSHHLPVMAGPRMRNLLEKEAPWRQLVDNNNIAVEEMHENRAIQLSEEVTITPILVPHRNEFSETYAFYIAGLNKKVLFIPDIDQWDEWELDIYEVVREVDVCLLDGTFHSSNDLSKISRDFKNIPHPFMSETIERLQDLTDETQIFFIHFNHSNPVLNTDGNVRREIEKKGFFIAEEEMEIEL